MVLILLFLYTGVKKMSKWVLDGVRFPNARRIHTGKGKMNKE